MNIAVFPNYYDKKLAPRFSIANLSVLTFLLLLLVASNRLVATLFISYLSKNSTIQRRLPEYYHTIQNHVFLLGQIKS